MIANVHSSYIFLSDAFSCLLLQCFIYVWYIFLLLFLSLACACTIKSVRFKYVVGIVLLISVASLLVLSLLFSFSQFYVNVDFNFFSALIKILSYVLGGTVTKVECQSNSASDTYKSCSCVCVCFWLSWRADADAGGRVISVHSNVLV